MVRSEHMVTPCEVSRNDLPILHDKRVFMKKERLLDDILKVYNERGYVNRKLLVESVTGYNVDFQLSKHGGLKKICRELGIEYRQFSKTNPDAIKADFLRVYKQLGKISKELYLQYGNYSSTAVRSAFGSYTKLFKTLNIPLNINTDTTKQDVLDNFLDFYNKYHTVSSTEYRKHGKYSEGTINNLFGSWCNLVKQFGMKPICEKVGKDKMIDDVISLYNEYGFLSAHLINQNCDFTYQAISRYYSMEDICKLVGDENAFAKSKSAGSIILRDILHSLYNNVIEEASFGWLINPKNGKRMYVDYYVPEKKMAFEYDGQQHNQYVEYFYKTFKNYYNAVYRDRTKEKLLAKHGIQLVRIDYSEPLTIEYLKEKCSI